MNIPIAPWDWRKDSGPVGDVDIAAIARLYCESRPYTKAALISGSWARGEARAESDVDLYVLIVGGAGILREQLFILNQPVQINCLSFENAVALVGRGAQTGNPYYVHCFSTAQHLHGERAICDKLISYATDIWKRGPGPYLPAQKDALRLAAVNGWLKLKRSSGFAVAVAANRLFDLLLRYLQMQADGWLFEDMWIERYSQIAPERLRKLSEALAAAVLGQTSPMLELGAEILGEGFCWTTASPVPIWPHA